MRKSKAQKGDSLAQNYRKNLNFELGQGFSGTPECLARMQGRQIILYPHSDYENERSSINNGTGAFPGSTMDRNPPGNAGDSGSIPGPGRFYMLQNN